MAMTLGGRGSTSSEINVTPMIDILLVLLIIFMVLPHPSFGEAAEIPRPPDAKASHPDSIVIQLKQAAGNERPKLQINNEQVSWGNLEALLEKIYSARNEKVAFLKGDPEVSFQFVAEVIDITHHAGVTHVGLM